MKAIKTHELLIPPSEDPFADAVEEFKILKAKERSIKEQIEEKKKLLVDFAAGHDVIKNGVSIKEIKPEGRIDYKQIPAVAVMTEEELSMYRTYSKPYWTVKAIF